MKYVAFYNRKQIEVEGRTSYDAYLKAIRIFKVPVYSKHLVTVVLAETKTREPVIHSTANL